MPLSVRLDNGKIIQGSINVWVVALIKTLQPHALATVAKKVEELNGESRIVTPEDMRIT